jgi:hypothetical protein
LVIAFVIHLPLALSPGLVLFPLGITYVLFGIGDHLYRRFSRRALPYEPSPTIADAQGNGRATAQDAQAQDDAVKKEERL